MPADAKKPVAITTGLSNQRIPAADQVTQMIPRSQQGAGAKRAAKAPFSWIWRGTEFVRVAPGRYDAICVGWKGPEYVAAYQRYSLRLNFRLLAEDVEVAMFFNFGRKPAQAPGPLSRYFRAWVMVNGGLPRRGQSMTPDIFMELSLLYTIRIADAAIDWKRAEKPECLIYSRAEEIIEVRRP